MIPGTTPKHIFKIPLDASQIKTVHIAYAQQDELVLVKTESDCELNGNTVTVKLSQEDTLKFNENTMAKVQLRIITTENESLATCIMAVSVGELLEDGVLE